MKKNMLQKKDRKNERGAAMVMVLLVSFLLLVASAGLLLETTMNTANVSDATAEQQAYNAAESGIQSALNVLRGNVPPATMFDPAKPATDPVNRINFTKAVSLASSNAPGDTNTSARLSRWLGYSSSKPDRVMIGADADGYAYNVSVTDPNQTTTRLRYSSKGCVLGDTDGVYTFGSGGNSATIAFIPLNKDLNVSSGSANTEFIKIQVLTLGSVEISEDKRFEITINMTAPYTTSRVVRGWIRKGIMTSASAGTVTFDFDTPAFQIMGSTGTFTNKTIVPNPVGTVTVTGTMTQAEPYRVIVRSIGYGPRGARKELEAVVQKNFFNGLGAPATLTLIGPPGNFNFSSGSSQNVTYNGKDQVSNVIIPPIGTSNPANLASVMNDLNSKGWKTDINGVPADISGEVPTWLENTTELDKTIKSLRSVANDLNRVYPNATNSTPPDLGNMATATGITFVDGDAEINAHNGGGLLIVTGKLVLKGTFTFNGLIIVTGSGGVERQGGGSGTIAGNMVIAPYNANNLNAGFLSPKYDINGGGSSEMVFNSNSIANGMTAVSNFVLGVAEK